MDLNIGSRVFDKFTIIGQIGAGGMGSIYKANHVLMNRDVVLKVIVGGLNQHSLIRFQNEAKALSKLNHPNIAKVFDFGLYENTPYLAIEFVEGITLSKMLDSGPLSPDDAIPILKQLCQALSHAHAAGIIHRDLKPSNIMLRQVAGETQVVLLDFGIAKLTDDSQGSLTRTGELVGSPLYMSPEQCLGAPVTHQTDQYSLGCVIFEMLTGEPPFIGESALQTMLLHQQSEPPKLSEICKQPVPESLERLVDRLLEKDADRRFGSIDEASKYLVPASKDESLTSEPLVVPARQSANFAKPLMIGLALTCVLLTAGLISLKQTYSSEKTSNKLSQEVPENYSPSKNFVKERAIPTEFNSDLIHLTTNQLKECSQIEEIQSLR
ncbi:MAG: serine/threonine protein kinase, partial [Cyanobacteria bacterium]|nr:serine/threonine protein kinase [Cyanobacteriota bacterium]